MTVHEIHHEIWEHVARNMTKQSSLRSLKERAVQRLFEDGRITKSARDALSEHANCVCCAIYYCTHCPLYKGDGGCGTSERGLYAALSYSMGCGNVAQSIELAEQIRDTRLDLAAADMNMVKLLEEA